MLSAAEACVSRTLEDRSTRTGKDLGWAVYPKWSGSKDQERFSSPSSSSSSLNTDEDNTEDKTDCLKHPEKSIDDNCTTKATPSPALNNSNSFFNNYWHNGVDDSILQGLDQAYLSKGLSELEGTFDYQNSQQEVETIEQRRNRLKMKPENHAKDFQLPKTELREQRQGNYLMQQQELPDKDWIKLYHENVCKSNIQKDTAYPAFMNRRKDFGEIQYPQQGSNLDGMFPVGDPANIAAAHNQDFKYGAQQAHYASLHLLQGAAKYPQGEKVAEAQRVFREVAGSPQGLRYGSPAYGGPGSRGTASVPIPVPQKSGFQERPTSLRDVQNSGNYTDPSLDDVMEDFRSNGWDCESLGLLRGSPRATIARAQAHAHAYAQAHMHVQAQVQAQAQAQAQVQAQAQAQAHLQAQYQAQATGRLRRPGSYPPTGQGFLQPSLAGVNNANMMESTTEFIDHILQRLLFMRQQGLSAQPLLPQTLLSQTPSYKKKRPVTTYECAFCRNNGEQESFYKNHMLRDHSGRVLCPVLRDFHCPGCGATGDHAHTIKYCPLTTHADGPSIIQQLKTLRLNNAKKRLGAHESSQSGGTQTGPSVSQSPPPATQAASPTTEQSAPIW